MKWRKSRRKGRVVAGVKESNHWKRRGEDWGGGGKKRKGRGRGKKERGGDKGGRVSKPA